MFELRVLQYFLTVAREQNITKAAQQLHITQPTLSRQLMQMEKDLGKQLLVRGTQRIELTKEGMLLRRRAEELLDLAHKTEKELREEKEHIAGEIFIGSGEFEAFRFVVKVMKEFSEKYPEVKFNVFSGTADDIKEKIHHGLIDIALLSVPVEISDFEFIRIYEKDRWGVVMPIDDPLAKKEQITKEDLIGKKIINSNPKLVKEEIENWFGDVYEKLDEVATINLFHNAITMVEEGLGYGITLESLISVNHTNVCFRPLNPPLETGSVLVWKKHQNFSFATIKFIDMLKQRL